MIRCRFSRSLFACALTLATLSSVHARPMVLEAREGILGDDDTSFLGASRPASPGNHYAYGWDHRDSTDKLNHESHGHGLIGEIEDVQFPAGSGDSIAAVTAIPEPSTYLLMIAGLAGIAMLTQRRRPRGQ